jgi:hypothetical protein
LKGDDDDDDMKRNAISEKLLVIEKPYNRLHKNPSYSHMMFCPWNYNT